jgi:transcriptional regulator with PAS, ATPase and Fis domain
MWVAVDSASLRLLEQVQKIARRAETLLIRGESGSGKNLLAQLVHQLAPNCAQPFLRLPCAQLPPALIEAELFGSEPVATGAGVTLRPGLLQLAGTGTVLLDEVAALSMPLQAKLLSALEQRRFAHAGSGWELPLEARIIALTAVDLERAVARRTFREDLYYRLQVDSFVLAPLRERPRDIRPLAEHFLAQFTDLHRKPHMMFSEPVLAALEGYHYPGNARELRDFVERAVLRGSAPEILLHDLPAPLSSTVPPALHTMSLEKMERKQIGEVLNFTRGRKTRAANILGISRKTLLEKRKRYGLG